MKMKALINKIFIVSAFILCLVIGATAQNDPKKPPPKPKPPVIKPKPKPKPKPMSSGSTFDLFVAKGFIKR